MSVYRRGRVWWISVSVGGRRVRVSAGCDISKAQAKELEAKIRADLHAGRVGRAPEKSISDALLHWIDNECQELKSAHKFESHARALLPYIKGRQLKEAPAVANDIKAGLRAQGLTPATINRRLAILRRVCNLAYRSWQWINEPIGERIQLLQERNERHIYLEASQVEALAAACPNPLAGDVVRLAAWTGLRRSELLRLIHSRADIWQGCIVLDAQTKSGRPRTIPVPEGVMPILERLPLPVSNAQLRKSWDIARRTLGLEDLRFHDLRHTYASWLVQSGAPIRVVQELLGHTSLAMTMRYSHLAPKHLMDAVTGMENNVRSQTVQNVVDLEKAKKG